jgi:hypothetical protein
MGAVYRARSPRGEEVALKLLAKTAPEQVARFERERRLLGDLARQGGFVPLLDAGSAPEGPFIVMPLMSGGTLRARLEKGPLGLAATLELGRALALALARAHERGIVHRDMKPENVLFDGAGRPFVADLGIAKHFDRDAAGASRSLSLSQGGTFRGTAGYASPEQATDSKSVGPASDVFALGAILHECLAGKPAFEGGTLVELMTKVASADYERLSPAAAPSWLARVLERALAPDPAARFADGRALLGALSGAGGRSAARVVPLLAAVTAVSLVAAIVVVARSRGPADPATRPAEAVGPKRVTDAERARVARALAGTGVVTSAEAPWAVVGASEELIAAAADHAVVYAPADVAAASSARPRSSMASLSSSWARGTAPSRP